MKFGAVRLSVETLALYGSAHAAVDAACSALLVGLLASRRVDEATLAVLALLYYLLAFGLQPLLGYAVDQWQVPREAAVAGCALTAGSLLGLGGSPTLAVCIAGAGNALFHAGGGSVSLQLRPGGAMAPGIFVAPGALGLWLGTLLGGHGRSMLWFVALLLVILCIPLRVHKVTVREDRPRSKPALAHGDLVLLFVLFSIAVRSFVSLAPGALWKSNQPAALLVLAFVLGKGLGGILADRFGWMRIAVSAQLLSAALLMLGGTIPALGILGMFFLTVPMPVTLAAVSQALPGEPAFAFGLAGCALLVGALPAFSVLEPVFSKPFLLSLAVLLSTLTLYLGLRLARQEVSSPQTQKAE